MCQPLPLLPRFLVGNPLITVVQRQWRLLHAASRSPARQPARPPPLLLIVRDPLASCIALALRTYPACATMAHLKRDTPRQAVNESVLSSGPIHYGRTGSVVGRSVGHTAGPKQASSSLATPGCGGWSQMSRMRCIMALVSRTICSAARCVAVTIPYLHDNLHPHAFGSYMLRIDVLYVYVQSTCSSAMHEAAHYVHLCLCSPDPNGPSPACPVPSCAACCTQMSGHIVSVHLCHLCWSIRRSCRQGHRRPPCLNPSNALIKPLCLCLTSRPSSGPRI